MKRLISFLLRACLLSPGKATEAYREGGEMMEKGLVEYLGELKWIEQGRPVPHEAHFFDVDGVLLKIDLDERAIYVDDHDPIRPLENGGHVPSSHLCAALHSALRMAFEGVAVDGRTFAVKAA